MNGDAVIGEGERRSLLRLQAVCAHLYEPVRFRLILQERELWLSAAEAFEPTGGLPLLVARALRAARLIHSEEFCRRAFPFELAFSTLRGSLTGLEVRLVQSPDASPSMGLLLLDFAAEEVLRGPNEAHLDQYLPDLDEATFDIVGSAMAGEMAATWPAPPGQPEQAMAEPSPDNRGEPEPMRHGDQAEGMERSHR